MDFNLGSVKISCGFTLEIVRINVNLSVDIKMLWLDNGNNA